VKYFKEETPSLFQTHESANQERIGTDADGVNNHILLNERK